MSIYYMHVCVCLCLSVFFLSTSFFQMVEVWWNSVEPHDKNSSRFTYSRALRHLHLIMAVGIFGAVGTAQAAQHCEGQAKKQLLWWHKQRLGWDPPGALGIAAPFSDQVGMPGNHGGFWGFTEDDDLWAEQVFRIPDIFICINMPFRVWSTQWHKALEHIGTSRAATAAIYYYLVQWCPMPSSWETTPREIWGLQSEPVQY